MLIDLLLLWLVTRRLSNRTRNVLYVTQLVLCLALAVAEVKYSFRLVKPGLDPTPPTAVILLRLGAIVAVLEAYFLSTLLWMPWLFDRMEKMPAEVLIAVRQLRARKSGFLTAISFLAFLGVGLGSFALCMTIAIMGGFGNDLKTKILGNNAHVVLDRERGGFTNWRPLLARIRAVPEVATATPLVQGEVMVTSQTNLSGVILRGIDPTATESLLNLRRDLIRGRLEYLAEPRHLDRLSPLERRPVSARGEEDLSSAGANLRRDPLEKAQHNAQTYNDWWLDRVYLITPATAIVGKFLMTFQDFPPSQTAGSFNLSKVQKQIEEAGKAHK